MMMLMLCLPAKIGPHQVSQIRDQVYGWAQACSWAWAQEKRTMWQVSFEPLTLCQLM
jgi:hypothetical protein